MMPPPVLRSRIFQSNGGRPDLRLKTQAGVLSEPPSPFRFTADRMELKLIGHVGDPRPDTYRWSYLFQLDSVE